MNQLLIATHNKGKVRELELELGGTNLELRSLADFPKVGEVAETGVTFAENAELKAGEYAKRTGIWTLADDSGLEVKALGNEPGIFSARYAGQGANDQKNLKKLLDELKHVPEENRSARFVCVIAVADPNGTVRFKADGICSGNIALTPSGSNGFGYDPVFVPTGFNETFGELSDSAKRDISHRAIATRKIIEYFAQNWGPVT